MILLWSDDKAMLSSDIFLLRNTNREFSLITLLPLPGNSFHLFPLANFYSSSRLAWLLHHPESLPQLSLPSFLALLNFPSLNSELTLYFSEHCLSHWAANF